MAMAHNVIGQLPPGQAAAVRDAVNSAFHDGLHAGTLVCAGIALASAIVVARLLPARDVTADLVEKEPARLGR